MLAYQLTLRKHAARLPVLHGPWSLWASEDATGRVETNKITTDPLGFLKEQEEVHKCQVGNPPLPL